MIPSFTYKAYLVKTFIIYQSYEAFKLQMLSAPLTSDKLNRSKTDRSFKKKNPKDDYQKNITINVVKCCIREMLNPRYRQKLDKRCHKSGVSLENVAKLVEPILEEVVLSLGDLKKLLTTGSEEELKAKKVFAWFLQWYLRHRYMHYLLAEGKMCLKQRYIEYKNKYLLYLLHQIRHDTSDKQQSTYNNFPLEEEQYSMEILSNANPKQSKYDDPPAASVSEGNHAEQSFI